MKFISKLYFNIFKRIGNLRLMFVVSCIFGIISLTTVSINALNRVYYYGVHAPLMPWEYYTLVSEIDGNVNFTDKDLETVYKLFALHDCRNGDIERAEQRYFLYDGKAGCERLEDAYKDTIKVSIYSFSYLCNYLWAIFWFYFPFLVVFPIKFIVDGYNEDKRRKNEF